MRDRTVTIAPITVAALAAALALLAACDPDAGTITGDSPLTPAAGARRCNGHAELCDRSLADVTFAGTHNSFSVKPTFRAGFANQTRDLDLQLADGVRAFMLDTYWHDPLFGPGRAALCHGNCTLGGWRDLVPALKQLRAFLDAHPDTVLQLYVEQHSLSPAQFADALAAAGLFGETYAHPSTYAPWPTLAQLIDARTRVIVFYFNAPAEQARPAWYMPMHAYVGETDYQASSPADLGCDVARGPVDAPIYFVDHFLSRPAGWEYLAEDANAAGVIHPRVQACEQRQLPSVVAVDFYELGDRGGDARPTVVQAADYLNGVD